MKAKICSNLNSLHMLSFSRRISSGIQPQLGKLFIGSILFLVLWAYLEHQWCHLDIYFNKYLLSISSLLAQNGVDVFLLFGGLLALIRDNQLMPWDYDLDFCINSKDTQKFLSLRDAFTSLGFTVYGRNEFIWQKLSGDAFQISAPILRLHITTLIYLEFYEMHDETLQSAKENGYDINGALADLNQDDKLSCIVPSEPCFEKSKILPLKKWNWSKFNVDVLVPNDPEYCLVTMYGEKWKIPSIKGWKPYLCYQQWTTHSFTIAKIMIVLWYVLLLALHISQCNMIATKRKSDVLKQHSLNSQERECLLNISVGHVEHKRS